MAIARVWVIKNMSVIIKKIDELMNIMKKHNVPFPNTYKDKGSSSDSKGKGKALMENSNSSKEWILDSSASYQMGSSKEDFSSLNQSKVSYIIMGDDTKMEVEGKGNVEMENREFKYVLYVPNISSNCLSIYQITHPGDGHRIEFIPQSV